MAQEPINIFSSHVDPGGVLRKILERFPDAEVVGRGEHWKTITIRLKKGRKSTALTFKHDRDYYGGSDWGRQMNGMQGYFARFPGGNRVPRVLGLIGTFKFALATEFDPDFDSDGDERLNILFGVTEYLDGVLFTPSTLRDASGRIILSADGEHDEEVTWPQSTPVVPASVELPEAEVGPEPAPPTPERVARRALALAVVGGRAVIERDHGPQADSGEKLKYLTTWAKDFNIIDELEPEEEDALKAKPGKLERQAAINCMWQVEGLGVLLWALKRYELPPYDTLVDLDELFDAAAFLKDPTKAGRLLDKPRLRPAKELETFRKQMLGYHWRLRDFEHVKQKPMDFRAFADDCWFGSFDASPFDVIDGDLAIRGKRIDKADAEAISLANSIAVERHRAINWLCWGPEVYSDADIST